MGIIAVSESPARIVPENFSHQPDPRQQAKIIGAIVRHNSELIAEPSVQLRPGERYKYLQGVRQGEIGNAKYSGLIRGIRKPTIDRSGNLDEREINRIFGIIAENRQLRGIVAYFAKEGGFQDRDSLTPQDLVNFSEDELPDALAYEQAIGSFLDSIERKNGPNKRTQYESQVDKLGRMVYGKQWEYLKQIRLLEKQARSSIEKPQVHDLRPGLEQAQQFNREHRLQGRVNDGYRDGGRKTKFDNEGRAINPSREVIVVDRQEDAQLRQMLEQAKVIKAQYKDDPMRIIYELSRLVDQRMYSPNAVSILERKLEKPPGKVVKIGDISVENGLAGVCRHVSLLFQVLAADIGIQTSLVRGYVKFNNNNIPGGHAWNEVCLNGKQYLVDIMNPPKGRDFASFDYDSFIKRGGFPIIGVNHSNNQYDRYDRYRDVKGRPLFMV